MANVRFVFICKKIFKDFLISDALYKWVTSGSNAGITADAGLGPLQFKESAGYEYGAPQAVAVGGQAPVAGGNQTNYFLFIYQYSPCRSLV